MKINENYLNLQDGYLFSTIAKKVKEFASENPDKKIIRMGIGDVTQPLVPAVITALQQATAEMGKAETFRGYGEEQGYSFLRDAIRGYYQGKGVTLDNSEIFVSDGAKSDVGNILDIFAADNTVLVPDPVYPVYVDTNIMHGRKIVYINGNIDNEFLPLPAHIPAGTNVDIIYMCSPNNPTGAVYTLPQLQQWVDYALDNNAVILFDAAYEAFVRDNSLPTSIYQAKGAEKCAIEFASFSKIAGFTGTRCGYTIVPQALVCCGVPLNKLWSRRQATKFNGVPYIVQRGAEAVLSGEGYAQIMQDINGYLENTRIITDTMDKLSIWYTGGQSSPYVWIKCPNSMGSWEFFDHLLKNAAVVTTPGAGFGANGEGFLRLSAFNSKANVTEAMKRFENLLM